MAVRRFSSSQASSRMRQALARQRQAANNLKQAVRRFDQAKRRAIDDYNRRARAYNSKVRAIRQRLVSDLNRLKSSTGSTRYVQFRTTVTRLHEAYVRVEERHADMELTDEQQAFLDLAGREAANSIEAAEALEIDDAKEAPGEPPADLQEAHFPEELAQLFPELKDRWKGAVFALHPRNPDAARHFCVSAREIFTDVLQRRAPDEDVIRALPGCPRTRQGTPSRRGKLAFLLQRSGWMDADTETFVSEDIDNIVDLFAVFNDSTHGAAGRFSLAKLQAVKKRVEQGLFFLARVAA